MIVALAGRAAEEVVFGRVTNGAANDLEKVTDIARSMVFEWGMADSVSPHASCRQLRALRGDEAATRSEQASLTDAAYAEALRLLKKHRAPLDRIAAALLEKETLVRDEVVVLLGDVEAESRASDSVGVPRIVAGAELLLPLARRNLLMSTAPFGAVIDTVLFHLSNVIVPTGPCRRRSRPGTACRSRRRRASCPPTCPGSRRPSGPCTRLAGVLELAVRELMPSKSA